jgi:hypothetical protein
MAQYSSHQWPSENQLLLLQAVLLQGDSARKAWEKWQLQNDIANIDAGSFLVIPQLYLNLRRHGIDGTTVNKLRGVYRQTWARNETALRGLLNVIRILQQHAISSVTIKGMPLALFYYEDPGARTMFDLDLLVAEADFPRAVDLFRRLGWSTIHGGRDLPPENVLQYYHAWSLQSPEGLNVDLHRRVVSVDLPPACDVDVMSRAVNRSYRDLTLKVPDSADMLLVSCLNARKTEPHAACRCVVDLVTQLNHPSGVPWDDLLSRAEVIGQMVPVADALTYVHRHFSAPVPSVVLKRLERLSPSMPEIQRYRRLAETPGGMFSDAFLWGDAFLWARYTGHCEAYGRKRNLFHFLKILLEYCRWKTGARSMLQLIPAMMRLFVDRRRRLKDARVNSK